MAEQIELEVDTPERQLVHENVDTVQLPGAAGYMGVLPGHAPLTGRLGAGVLTYAAGGRRRSLAVADGFIEALPGSVRILARAAERAEDIDVPRARAALERASQAMASATMPEACIEASAAAHRAAARIAAASEK